LYFNKAFMEGGVLDGGDRLRIGLGQTGWGGVCSNMRMVFLGDSKVM